MNPECTFQPGQLGKNDIFSESFFSVAVFDFWVDIFCTLTLVNVFEMYYLSTPLFSFFFFKGKGYHFQIKLPLKGHCFLQQL